MNILFYPSTIKKKIITNANLDFNKNREGEKNHIQYADINLFYAL